MSALRIKGVLSPSSRDWLLSFVPNILLRIFYLIFGLSGGYGQSNGFGIAKRKSFYAVTESPHAPSRHPKTIPQENLAPHVGALHVQDPRAPADRPASKHLVDGDQNLARHPQPATRNDEEPNKPLPWSNRTRGWGRKRWQ